MMKVLVASTTMIQHYQTQRFVLAAGREVDVVVVVAVVAELVYQQTAVFVVKRRTKDRNRKALRCPDNARHDI
jgi:hypothetical protein